ncbi:N-[(2S)-2-amino-2-carboxyethyl]-L-glutamate dehydrogenase SbnB [Siminovitchia terrae]|uniref:N-[(2S)-2-amino-2-carboxyethyl]-L-glutamate dehydrogenase SbnB n=1 Tax=Siminovitchia terrae TaxID=1914933 RepID=A0ABQ4L0D6_SIMTE|nr:ornithine cyclodeaminase family protein [Siminovitchia terrae]GIN97738.1 N-[(2S)-2-amino-2-carboxyethyl]-L-glutamate dehydrogenase SbnB [Siminovitchia terrae]
MKNVDLLYLTQEMILDLGISMKEIIPIIEQVLKEHEEGSLEIPPKPGIHPQKNTFIHAMPGYIPGMKVSGIKWVSGYPENFKHDLPQIMGVLILNDVETGAPQAIMDCRWITAVRTSVMSAVTAKYCARKNARVAGIIGAGIQGKFHALALKEVLPELETIKIFDIKEESMDDFVKVVSKKTGLQVIKASNCKEAVTDSDVVITATQRLEKPIIEFEWLKEGVFGVGLESGRAWGDAILNMDKFVTDDWAQTKKFAEAGGFPKEIKDFYIEVGKFVNGKQEGRENDKENIIAGNVGIAALDLAIGNMVYKRALDEEKGMKLPLMETENIIF